MSSPADDRSDLRSIPAALDQLSEAVGRDGVAAIVASFLDALPGRNDALAAAVSQRDADALSRVAHSYKSAAALVGATTLSQRVAEMALDSDDLAEVLALAQAARGSLRIWCGLVDGAR